MKRPWLITSIIIAAMLVWAVAVVRCPRTVPLDECSDVYRHYAGSTDIEASYIKNYHINDTLTVPVTILRARNDSGWSRMEEELNIIEPPHEILEEMGENLVSMKLVPKHDYTLLPDTVGLNDQCAIYWKEMTIVYFHVATQEQADIVMKKQIDISIKRSKNY